jgi:hypothetical protein
MLMARSRSVWNSISHETNSSVIISNRSVSPSLQQHVMWEVVSSTQWQQGHIGIDPEEYPACHNWRFVPQKCETCLVNHTWYIRGSCFVSLPTLSQWMRSKSNLENIIFLLRNNWRHVCCPQLSSIACRVEAVSLVPELLMKVVAISEGYMVGPYLLFVRLVRRPLGLSDLQ